MNSCDILKKYICDDIVNHIIFDYLVIDRDEMFLNNRLTNENLENVLYISYMRRISKITKETYKRYIDFVFKRIKEENKNNYFLSAYELRHRSYYTVDDTVLLDYKVKKQMEIFNKNIEETHKNIEAFNKLYPV